MLQNLASSDACLMGSQKSDSTGESFNANSTSPSSSSGNTSPFFNSGSTNKNGEMASSMKANEETQLDKETSFQINEILMAN